MYVCIYINIYIYIRKIVNKLLSENITMQYYREEKNIWYIYTHIQMNVYRGRGEKFKKHGGPLCPLFKPTS